MTNMIPSPKGEALIKSYEQCRLSAYMPTPKDRPTIGWGTTGKDIHLAMTWTQAQCDARFSDDLARFAHSVNALLTAPTTQNQFDSLVSFAYNEGAHALQTSILLMYHNQGHANAAAPYFMHYTTQAGTVLKGLVRRRKEEQALYLTT